MTNAENIVSVLVRRTTEGYVFDNEAGTRYNAKTVEEIEALAVNLGYLPLIEGQDD